LVDKEKMEFEKQVVREIENFYPEKFEEVIFST
jgi:hypothetical protein